MIDIDYNSENDNLDWFETEYKRSLIDLRKEPKRPEPVISIGNYNWNGKVYDNAIMTAGEMSAISAPSKSFKTYFKSHLASAFIRNANDAYLDNIKGHRKENQALIDIDTEQGTYNAYHTFNRTKQMSEYQDMPFYYPFKLRHLNPTKRVSFLDHLIKTDYLDHTPKLIFVDGIADLIEDTNDLLMSNEVAEKIMYWTDIYKCHVCVIIHNAYGTKKPTGHLGSVMIKKAETVINLLPEKTTDPNGKETKTGIITATHQYSRKAPFEDFDFEKHPTQDRLRLVDNEDIF